jgi:hypothetical protein
VEAMITPPVIGVIIFLTILSGAGLGMLLGRLLPAHHRDDPSRSVITVATAVVGTASALVLGLLISSASSAFQQRSSEVGRFAVDIIRVDSSLRNYGLEADSVRQSLARYAAIEFEEFFPTGSDKTAKVDKPGAVQMLRGIRVDLLALRPSDASQHQIREKALQLVDEMGDTRWLLAIQQNISPIPTAFLIMLVFWLTILFGTFGLFAPRNVTVAAALALSVLAVSGGLELVLDMTDPFSGFVRISSVPMRDALEITRQQDLTP